MSTPWAAQEFAGSVIPNRRSMHNLIKSTEVLSNVDGSSYSSIIGQAGRQAAKRLFDHTKCTPENLLKGHYEQTAARCSGQDFILCIQDTTTLDYSTHTSKENLGPINSNLASRGLLAHSVLAFSSEGLPLGLLHLDLHIRDREAGHISQDRRTKAIEDKESMKWLNGAKSVAKLLSHVPRVLIVQDREADIFDFFAQPRRTGFDILIRACHPRKVLLTELDGIAPKDPTTMTAAIENAKVIGQIKVRIPRRGTRKERIATLNIQVRPMTILPPHRRPGKGENVTVIRAEEANPEPGSELISWTLMTTVAINSLEEAEKMVKNYEKRWVIERFHHTLKSGCKVEKLQICSAHNLKNALAVYFMVAWKVMSIKYMADIHPDESPKAVLDSDEIETLKMVCKRPVDTIRQAAIELARLVGYEYYKNAPLPGDLTIWRGIKKIQLILQGRNLERIRLT